MTSLKYHSHTSNAKHKLNYNYYKDKSRDKFEFLHARKIIYNHFITT